MTPQEILQALYAGKINLEEARKAFIMRASSKPPSDLSTDTMLSQRTDLASSVTPSERVTVVSSGAIAIVGMSGKYPDAKNLSEYWDNLVQGKNAVREIPLSRFDVSDYYDPTPGAPGKISCKWLGALDEIEYFDPLFFHISPAEAEVMDPQHRLFLEEGYKAFEDAGYSPALLSNRKCGVYLGVISHEYGLLLSQTSEADLLGTSSSIAAARLAYLLNLKGPAIAIDTACSSSLVATHLACQALWNQEIDMALVGSVNLCLTPDFYVRMCHAGMLSPSGQCKTFDASANGFVPGEGVGALVLKRLADAEADHDQIYGVIIASGMNQDGATNGITAPSVKSQIDLACEIYEKYQIDPESISYVEMHGTGTKLGDPIELKALATVFQEKTQRTQYCAIGSVKSNIGHTLAAAGLAGLQKVLLALKQKKLVPTLHFEQPNPQFDFAASPFYVNTCVQDWKRTAGMPRRAAVSSFGFSGTNAHLVVEEYLPARETEAGQPRNSAPLPRSTETPSLFVLSAKSETQLKSYAQEMRSWIQSHAELALPDIAFTCQVGRQAMEYRLAIETDSRKVLLQRLEGFVDGHTSTGVHTGQVKHSLGQGNDAVLFEEDSDGLSLLHIWCQKRNLAKLAQVWVRGVNVDWMELYGGDLPHRISLPTYHFAHQCYWIPTRDSASPVVQSTQVTTNMHAALSVVDPGLTARLEEELTRSLAQALHMKQSDINVEQPLVEVGLDSISGVEWIQAINQQYGLSLTVTKVYDYPTLQAFAGFLAKEREISGGRLHLQKLTTPMVAGASLTPDPSLLELPEKADPGLFLREEEANRSRGCEPETDAVVAIDEIEPGIVQITMQDRAHKNMFSPALVDGMIKAFRAISQHPSYKVVILTGYDSYFASGGTKEGLLAIQEGKRQFTDVEIYSLALDCKLPVIAAMQGHGIGAGWSLGMFCDFILMSQESSYTSNYMKYGFTPGAGATLIFPEKLGASLAQEVLYTGKQFRGSDLEAKGVAFSVCPRKEVLPNALQLARELAQAPRESLIALKELLAKSLRERVSATYDHELAMHERTFVNQPEVKERIEAIFGKVSTNLNNRLKQTEGELASPVSPTYTESLERQNAIAVIGMSGKYPDAGNLEKYWKNLVQGKNAVREIPPSRFDVSGYYDPSPAAYGKIYCKWLGALDGIEHFDPLFFHLSPAEAAIMDPQQRLFLEEGYKALEDAGYSPGLLSDRNCGVYLGISGSEYGLLLHQHNITEMRLLGTSPAIAAARIAYLLNLKGPALAIDTACSSSLVATHLACQALRDREIDMALVGGVSLCLTSDLYMSMCSAGMLSPDGKCKTCDASANGFVPGEGVGALVLKRLADAEADHDHIHAVIIGSGMNQDGATNGITAPSVKSQIDLVREVYEKYHVDSESISYVEMHGTGTKLGDPIELEALATVFSEKTQRKQYCAIGSVKTNIGHTLAAAGLAGLQKVLLSMKDKKLVPSLHFEQPNEHFDFATSPFYVNTELQDWNQTAEGKPRRAAVSSFSFSGTNAHVVLEEYFSHSSGGQAQGTVPTASPTVSPSLFVLSAKSEQQLKSYAQEMNCWIQAHAEFALEDMAFTLQIGRDAMDYRLAILADSRETLLQRLETFVENQASTGVYTDQVKKSSSRAGSTRNDERLLEADEDEQSLHIWYQEKSLEKIAQVWVKGVNIDWMQIYTSGRVGCTSPYRVSLPTYPFARERYWLPTTTRSTMTDGVIPTVGPAPSAMTFAILHPLVQRNTSTLGKQRFSSTFDGQEFFLTDHQVLGQRIMPAVAYLEMARAAIDLARESSARKQGRTLHLSQVEWIRPLVIGNQPVEVQIVLERQERQKIVFTIRHQTSEIEDEELAPISRGRVELDVGEEVTQSLDLSAIQTRSQHSSLSASQCYQHMRSLGISYGPAFQGIKQLHIGADEVLAQLRLPAVGGMPYATGIGDDPNFPRPHPYVLHPGMLDAALQACMGLLVEENKQQQLHLPFALEELSLVSALPTQGWVWARRRSWKGQEGALGTGPTQGTGSAQGTTPTGPVRVPLSVFDLDVCDDEGRVVLRLRGLSIRMLRQASTSLSVANGHTLKLVPLWDPVVLLPQAQSSRLPLEDPGNQVVIVGGSPDEQSAIAHFYPHAHTLEILASVSIERLAQDLQALGAIQQVFWLAPCDSRQELSHESILATQQQGVLAAFRMIKALLQLGYGSQPLGFTVITHQARTLHGTETIYPTHASLLGLFGSLSKDASHWNIQLVDLPSNAPLPLADLLRLPADPHGQGWLYRNGHWYQQILVPLEHPTEHPSEAYRRGGVYVVIGGAGGIGTVWSEYLIRRYQAQIIWIGRRKIDAGIIASQERLATLGPKPQYMMADATDRRALQQAYEDVKQHFGQIHGVVHSAIVLRDQSLANMDEQGFQAALAAKVDVSVRLAQVFEQEPLDFVLFFSSLNAFTRNAGQSNYAAGCTFEDAFAARLRQDWRCKVKVMNWGYWGNVGVVAEPAYRERMAQAGIGSLEPAEAMETLEHLLAGPVDQMVVLKTTQLAAAQGSQATGGKMMQTAETLTVLRSEPSPTCIRSLRESCGTLKGIIDAETYKDIQEMEELLSHFLWSHLQSLGLFKEQHAVLANLREQAGISKSYERWLQASMAFLERRHSLQCYDNTTCTIMASALAESTVLWQHWDQHKEHWMQNTALKARVVLVETMLRALPTILTGQRSATEVLFPNGSMRLVEGIYQDNLIADAFNDVLARLLVAYLQERLAGDRNARMRILEIGAGVGGTTSRVLPIIQPFQASIAEYCYSDISEAFLHYGEQRYAAEHPYMTYQIFNVEKPLAEQGIEPGSYDVVIAANVLHATSNIRHTVRNAKAALKMHGLLLLNEITGTSFFAHLTFGLLPGWWAYEDPELRVPDCPALSTESWEAVLSSEGFGAIYFPTHNMQRTDQQIIVAESNGVIRQQHVQSTAKTSPSFVSRDSTEPLSVALPHTKVFTKQREITDQMIKDHVQSIILESMAEVLKVQERLIQEDRSFSEYGVDSIVAIKLINVINQKSNLILQTTALFDYNNAEQLLHYILREHTATLRATLQERTGNKPHQQAVSQRIGTVETDPRKRTAVYFPRPSDPLPHEKPLSAPANHTLAGSKDPLSLRPPKYLPLRGQAPSVPTAPICAPTSPSPVLSRSESKTIPIIQHEPIAIIGMSGRFARSKTVSELWEHLANGTDLVGEVSRWDTVELAPASFENKPYCKHGSFLEGIDLFDPLFFNISGLEATYMDPQQRLVLEEAWKALEDAGYVGTSIEGQRCGVYVGCATGDYQRLFDSEPPAQAFWGNAGSVIPARIAYYLNLVGPAVAIDTACSSSLVAMHLACQGLWSGEIDTALAGGVFLLCTPQFFQAANRAEMLSVTGHCSTFDNRADGFVPGEGVGVVVLKRLKDALDSGDHVYGVIRGSGINQDGTTKGITAPSANSQERLLCSVYDTFQIHPEQIQMVEAHGTGTKLGDPIEFEALTRAFRKYTKKTEYCALGSIKSNLGHAVTTAGVAGIFKILLSFQHKQIPPSLHFQSWNEHIQFKDGPFYVNTQLQDWLVVAGDAHGSRRRAAISSFSLSGTNAHMVIEEAPEYSRRHAEKPGYLIVLSARTSDQLRQQVEQLVAFCGSKDELDCGNISYTLLLGRKHLKHRLACVVHNHIEMVALLGKWLEKGKVQQVSVSNLENRELEENASLRRYGNQCIEDCLRTTEQGTYLEQLTTIANLYLQGYALTFERLFAGDNYARISLPTYPFALERYWVDEVDVQSSASVGQAHRHHPDSEVRNDEKHVPVHQDDLNPQRLHGEAETRTVLLIPNWKEEVPPIPDLLDPVPTRFSLVFLCEPVSIEAAHIQARLAEGGYCRSLPTGTRTGASPVPTALVGVPTVSVQQSRREPRFQDIVIQLIQEIQQLLRSRLVAPAASPQVPILVQVVVVRRGEPTFLEALIGVLKTAQQEYPKLQAQLIEIEGEPEEGELLAWLRENQLLVSPEQHILYRGSKRWVRQWQEHPPLSVSPKMPWKEGGCYLISGGAGGMARLFVQEITQQVQKATIILVGRSLLSAEQHAQLDQISKQRIQIDYQQIDVSDEPAMYALIQQVLERYGHLDGIIHAAGVLRDSLLLNKTPQDIQAVLAPKVIGVELLDKVSQQLPLDFFILFSSLAAVTGHVGQADYAAANAYLDAFAHARQALVQAGDRQGVTISINWPLWEDGGMQIGAETVQIMRERLGGVAMRTETGMSVFYQALACGQAQVVVAHGQVELIKERLLHQSSQSLTEAVLSPFVPEEEEPAITSMEQEVGLSVGTGSPVGTVPDARPPLQERAEAYFKKQLATVIKIPVQQIEVSAPLENYGFDSVMAVRFIRVLEDSFGPLSKTLLFEYPTLRSVTEYFLHSYPKQLSSVLKIEEISVGGTSPNAVQLKTTGSTDPVSLLSIHVPTESQQDKEARVSEIAIIGVAGRYPGARDLRAFWENLCTGKDCVTEIPPERWDHRLYFDADKNQPGTTCCKWGGFLEGVDEFDPVFFNISPREAERMDPQERLFLECAFATLEDAGYPRPRNENTSQDKGLGSNVGVFVGVMYEEYQLFGAQAQIQGRPITVAGSPSSIANRVSYFCNFHGPSLAVDTMCSSSLTAIHLACQSIQHGDCELAIAGGVNVSIHPNKYLFLGQGKFVSGQGRCTSFGQGADGYVPSEGVGAILLKPLAQAETDGDHIYAIIKATAINHGGKTNGYTVPNPHAQTEVIGRALKDAAMDPRTISYIEAHGTGTQLGDPIEIAALTRAFEASPGAAGSGRRQDPTKQYCAIGSVKSNIGHAESAAGIAGVTKVLLQMRYGQLVPSLHSRSCNPHIDFSATPFVVQQELSEWKRPQILDVGEGKDGEGDRDQPCLLPRRAGISSFGAGGSNAHVILEEYMAMPQREEKKRLEARSEPRTIPPVPTQRLRPTLILLSARTQEQLHERAQQLLAWIREEAFVDEDLDNLAYTLQVGREAMEERLALQVNSLQELEEKLQRYIEGRQGVDDWYRGKVKRHTPIGAFSTDEDGQKTITAWMKKGKYEKLLEWWVNGLTVDWKQLYGEHLPHRISLPTYPFARERYWLPISPAGAAPIGAGFVPALTTAPVSIWEKAGAFTPLHPLVQRNCSDIFAQRFSSTFDGQEFFLADHQVLGQRIMPAVAYLEMARAAIDLATRSSTRKQGRTLHLSQIEWIRPLVIGKQPVEVQIVLEHQEGQRIAFTISRQTSETENEEGATLISEGRAELDVGEEATQSLDLTAIQTRCQHSSLSASQCYQHYRELGISYGPAFQGLEHLSVGEGEVLARLRMPLAGVQPPHGQSVSNDFVLHPCMADAALQACIGLLIEENEQQELHLPFALEELSIVSTLPTQGWVWARRRSWRGQAGALGTGPTEAAQGTGSAQGTTPTGPVPVPLSVFDLDVCDDEGRIALRLRGLSTRQAPASPSVANGHTLKLFPLWDPVVLLPQAQSLGLASGQSPKQVVIVGGTLDEQSAIAHVYPHAHTIEIPMGLSIERLAQDLQELGTIQQIFWFAPHDPHLQRSHESILAAQQQGVLAAFRMIKALLPLGYGSQALGFTVITHQARLLHVTETIHPTHASLLGLFGSLAKEASHWNIQQVDLPPSTALPLAEILRLPADSHGQGWLCRNGQWYREILVPLEHPSEHEPEAYRRGGVYVVIGGAGGIGTVWSEYLIRKYQAQIIWIGRRTCDANIVASQERLAHLGPRPQYIMADATNRRALQQAYEEVKQHFGQIHGVVHSAIVLHDQSLMNMDEQRFQAALSAKVDVSVRLAQVFAQEPLDFVLFFSSLVSFTRSAGQSNYAAGCTFEDAFAARLRQDWRCKVKVMNWGYWGNVGIVTEPTYRERMAQLGIGSLETAEAMEALEVLLAGPVDQMAVLKTTQAVNPVRMLMSQSSQAMGGEIIQAKEIVTALESKHIPSFISSLHNYRAPLPGPPTKLIGVVAPEADTSRLEEITQEALRRTAAEVIQVKSGEIESDTALLEYGFDLAALAELTNRLNRTYHLQLAPTLFLEAPTLQQLAHYLVQRHQDAMRKHFKLVLDLDSMKNARADINA